MEFLHCPNQTTCTQNPFSAPFAHGEPDSAGADRRGFGARDMKIAWPCSSKPPRAAQGVSGDACTRRGIHSFGTRRPRVSAERPVCDIACTCTGVAPVIDCGPPAVFACVAYEQLFYARAFVQELLPALPQSSRVRNFSARTGWIVGGPRTYLPPTTPNFKKTEL
jgi:hypothetical protein